MKLLSSEIWYSKKKKQNYVLFSTDYGTLVGDFQPVLVDFFDIRHSTIGASKASFPQMKWKYERVATHARFDLIARKQLREWQEEWACGPFVRRSFANEIKPELDNLLPELVQVVVDNYAQLLKEYTEHLENKEKERSAAVLAALDAQHQKYYSLAQQHGLV